MAGQFNRFIFIALLAISVSLFSCSGDGDGDGKMPVDTGATEQPEETITKIGGKIFPIPSPYQTTMLIKKLESNYNKALLNDPGHVGNYATTYKKALNLGAYGADLGYITVYDQSQDAIRYFALIKKLSDDLGVTSAFDQKLVKKIEQNIGNQDSLMGLVSEGFRAIDTYLKTNERPEVGALVLTGGWIEGIYFATTIAQQTNHQELINRIGEQKTTVNNLVDMLREYRGLEGFPTEVVDQLISLAYDFDGVEFKYTYDKPEVYPDKKLTVINSESQVIISPDQLKSISEKIQTLRNQIVQ